MKVSYNKLWKLLIDRNMKKMDLLGAIEISPNTLAKLGRNEDVSMDVLRRICEYLECDIGDIMEMVPDKDGE
jgi:DNA-binding Xre family transcriptional regulator